MGILATESTQAAALADFEPPLCELFDVFERASPLADFAAVRRPGVSGVSVFRGQLGVVSGDDLDGFELTVLEFLHFDQKQSHDILLEKNDYLFQHFRKVFIENCSEVWTSQKRLVLVCFYVSDATPLMPILIGLGENRACRLFMLGGNALHFHDSGNECGSREEHINCALTFSFSHFL